MNKGIKKLYDRICAIGKKASPPPTVDERLLRLTAGYRNVDTKLRCLASACGNGDAVAMLELSEYLRETMPEDDGAARMWLLRAAVYGNAAAQERVREEMRQNPHFLEKSFIPCEYLIPGKRANRRSGYSGKQLNEVGLLLFHPERYYLLAGINQHRTMLVRQEAGYDSADEDGYGAETYYNMFYLDEFFQPIPGVPIIENVSDRDIRYSDGPEKEYGAMTHAMVEAAGKREQIPLWMEFAE